MGYLIGALVVVFGIALVISGATGSAQSLFSSVTGKSATASTTDTTASNTADLLASLSTGSQTPAGTASTTAGASPYTGLSGLSGTVA